MSRRKIDRISPISATAPSSPVSIWQTNSILTDPDGRWVAARQAAITAGLERRVKEQPVPSSGGQLRFSGESDRIGEGVWDEKAEFGNHYGYL